MVIIFEGNLISSVPKTLQDLFNRNPNIQLVANKFRNETVRVVGPRYSLFVGQGEYAVLPSCDQTVKIIGSDEATTCHILILKHPSGTVAVAHFDGSEKDKEIFQQMIVKFTEIEFNVTSLEAYVVGGYESLPTGKRGKANISEELSIKILAMFSEQHFVIHILLWCTFNLNTKYIHNCTYPLFNGLAFNKETSEVFPAVFAERCPNYLLRCASHFVESDICVRNLYDFRKKCVSIAPFYNWNNKYFAYISHLSDDDILKHFSTSPEAEQPGFSSRMRSAFFLLGYNSTGSLFPKMQPRTYIMDSEGKWVEKS